MVEAARDRFGRLDFLDNNVGIGSRGSVVDETEENWRRVMQVNVESMFLAAKHAIPAMAKAGGGAIVNVSSISALRPRGLTVYSASKGAVIALTRAMAVDHGKDGIRVNCVRARAGLHADGLPAGMSAAARIAAARPPCWGARAPAGTSATPCASCSPTTRATSPVTSLVVDGGADAGRPGARRSRRLTRPSGPGCTRSGDLDDARLHLLEPSGTWGRGRRR